MLKTVLTIMLTRMTTIGNDDNDGVNAVGADDKDDGEVDTDDHSEDNVRLRRRNDGKDNDDRKWQG